MHACDEDNPDDEPENPVEVTKITINPPSGGELIAGGSLVTLTVCWYFRRHESITGFSSERRRATGEIQGYDPIVSPLDGFGGSGEVKKSHPARPPVSIRFVLPVGRLSVGRSILATPLRRGARAGKTFFDILVYT